MSAQLKIASDLSLPLELITDRSAILATTGAGKTYLLRVIVEEVLAASQQVVVLDPKGDFWGLRSTADGKSAGFPIPVFGGEHADLPLEEGSGAFIAELIVRERLSAILDMSLFSKGKMLAWATEFAEQFYHRNREAMLLAIDEAHTFAPQKFKGHERMLGAFTDLVGKGRKRGIGTALASQRSALLNKDVLDLTATLIALRTGSARDRDAIDAWIEYNATPEVRRQIMGDLPQLENGEAWIYSPHSFKLLKRITVREAQTFDSSATPKPGQAVRKPKTLAEIDVGAVSEQMAGAVERAKATDPKHLQREVRRLAAELDKERKKAPAAAAPKEIRVPVLEGELAAALASVLASLRDAMAAEQDIRERIDDAVGHLSLNVGHAQKLLAEAKGLVESHRWPTAKEREDPPPVPVQPRGLVERAREAVASDPAAMELSGLSPAARRAVEQLVAVSPARLTWGQLAALAKVKWSGGAGGQAKRAILAQGWAQTNGKEVYASQAAIDLLGSSVPAPQSQAEVLDMWRGTLKGAQRRMFDFLVEVSPEAYSSEGLAEAVSMAAGGGAFQGALRHLVRNNLVAREQGTYRVHPDLIAVGV